MKDTETNILKAFLAALLQQPEPLPPEIQTQLNQLAPNLEGAIGKLEALAEQYKPLSDSFEAILNYWETRATQRSKGDLPDPVYEQSDPLTIELENTAYRIRKSDDAIDNIQALQDRASQTFSSPDSWQAAKDIIIPPLQY